MSVLLLLQLVRSQQTYFALSEEGVSALGAIQYDVFEEFFGYRVTPFFDRQDGWLLPLFSAITAVYTLYGQSHLVSLYGPAINSVVTRQLERYVRGSDDTRFLTPIHATQHLEVRLSDQYYPYMFAGIHDSLDYEYVNVTYQKYVFTIAVREQFLTNTLLVIDHYPHNKGVDIYIVRKPTSAFEKPSTQCSATWAPRIQPGIKQY